MDVFPKLGLTCVGREEGLSHLGTQYSRVAVHHRRNLSLLQAKLYSIAIH